MRICNMILIDKPNILQGRRILIATTASISIYKSLEIVSTLKKLGANLRVVMSEESKKFICPLSFEALTHTPVLHQESESWIGDIENKNLDSKVNQNLQTKSYGISHPLACNHISYAKWAELILIAPATANTIAKLAHGIADNVLLSTILASEAKRILAPSMNTQMLENQITQTNLEKLKEADFEILSTRNTLLACNTRGDGALCSIEEIIFRATRALLKKDFWEGKSVIITGGGSREDIDSVRCLSNHSSGLQASTLAVALYSLGAKVTFISSSFPITLPEKIYKIPVKTSKDYHQALISMQNPKERQYLFMAAAIADFIPKNPINGKIKKSQAEEIILECQRSIDILSNLESKYFFKIGFKAELDSRTALQYAQEMLNKKECEVVCLNILEHHNSFGSKQNAMTLLSKSKTKNISLANKLELSFQIAEFIMQI